VVIIGSSPVWNFFRPLAVCIRCATRQARCSVSTPSRRPVKFGTSTLSEAEKEAQLGRSLAHGVSLADYRALTGRWPAGGTPR
jgi:hypothetical protein